MHPNDAIPPELIGFLDTLSEPHVLFDREHRIVAANAAYRNAFPNDNALIGQRCHAVPRHVSIARDPINQACPLEQSLKNGQRSHFLQLHHTDNGDEYIKVEITPLHNATGEVSCFVEKLAPGNNTGQHLPRHEKLIGQSPPFQYMMELVARAAPTDARVLLLGESGTGKELVANIIHLSSKRSSAPVVTVDCSHLPEPLFESELFGHERGAFTGAGSRKSGLIEAANGGTLFFDEIGDIPLSMQIKLLRLLETGTYRRVGGTELRHADIRLISATHRPIRQLVAEKLFREDLFFRINTFPITLPPLRERISDLPILVDGLLARVAPNRRLSLAPNTIHALAEYPFPGNVRELRNILERAHLMCDGEIIHPEHLTAEIIEHQEHRRLQALAGKVPHLHNAEENKQNRFDHLQKQAMIRVVSEHRGSRRELANKLGISERTLYRKLQSWGIA